MVTPTIREIVARIGNLVERDAVAIRQDICRKNLNEALSYIADARQLGLEPDPKTVIFAQEMAQRIYELGSGVFAGAPVLYERKKD